MVIGRVDGQEILEPGNFWVRVAAGSAEHGGGPRALHHLELGAHVYGGEPRGQLVLWKRRDTGVKRGSRPQLISSVFSENPDIRLVWSGKILKCIIIIMV